MLKTTVKDKDGNVVSETNYLPGTVPTFAVPEGGSIETVDTETGEIVDTPQR